MALLRRGTRCSLGLLAISSAVLAAPAATPADPNAIDRAPRVLHDEAEQTAFFEAFPAAQYKRYCVHSTGACFYIDDRKDLIKSFIVRGIRWEEQLAEVFARYLRPGDRAIDVGAHIGTHTMDLSALVGPTGHVYSFEPQKKLYRELVMNVAVNLAGNDTPLRYAIGSGEPRVVHMGRAQTGNEGGTGLGEGGDAVELRALDSFGFSRIALIKIDVEGYEDNVLDGARALIEASHPVIVVEIRGGEPYATASTEERARIDATKAKIASMGYIVQLVGGADYVAVPCSRLPGGIWTGT